MGDYPLNGEAKGILAEIVATHFDSAGMIPSERLITIEDRDEALVINSCQGTELMRLLATICCNGKHPLRKVGQANC